MLRYIAVVLLGTLLCLQLSETLPVNSDGHQSLRKELYTFVLYNVTNLTMKALRQIATVIKRILHFADTNPAERSVKVREQLDQLREFYRKSNNITENSSAPEQLAEAENLLRSFSPIYKNYKAFCREYPTEITVELTFSGQGLDDIGREFNTWFYAFVGVFRSKMNEYIASLSDEEKKADLVLLNWYENLARPTLPAFQDFLELY